MCSALQGTWWASGKVTEQGQREENKAGFYLHYFPMASEMRGFTEIAYRDMHIDIAWVYKGGWFLLFKRQKGVLKGVLRVFLRGFNVFRVF